MRDFVLLLLFTGMRREEAASLRWSDLVTASHIPSAGAI
jgi:integrase